MFITSSILTLKPSKTYTRLAAFLVQFFLPSFLRCFRSAIVRLSLDHLNITKMFILALEAADDLVSYEEFDDGFLFDFICSNWHDYNNCQFIPKISDGVHFPAKHVRICTS